MLSHDHEHKFPRGSPSGSFYGQSMSRKESFRAPRPSDATDQTLEYTNTVEFPTKCVMFMGIITCITSFVFGIAAVAVEWGEPLLCLAYTVSQVFLGVNAAMLLCSLRCNKPSSRSGCTSIIITFLTIGTTIVAVSTVRLVRGEQNEGDFPYVILWFFSISFFTNFWALLASVSIGYKYSHTLLRFFAMETALCLKITAGVFLGLFIRMENPHLWWIEPAISLLIGILSIFVGTVLAYRMFKRDKTPDDDVRISDIVEDDFNNEDSYGISST